MSRKKNAAESLRGAIREAERQGMTRGAIAKAAEMPRSQLTRVATGETTPRLDTAERIAAVIGHEILIKRKVAN